MNVKYLSPNCGPAVDGNHPAFEYIWLRIPDVPRIRSRDSIVDCSLIDAGGFFGRNSHFFDRRLIGWLECRRKQDGRHGRRNKQSNACESDALCQGTLRIENRFDPRFNIRLACHRGSGPRDITMLFSKGTRQFQQVLCVLRALPRGSDDRIVAVLFGQFGQSISQ